MHSSQRYNYLLKDYLALKILNTEKQMNEQSAGGDHRKHRK